MASRTSDAPKGRSGIQHPAKETFNNQNGFYHREGKKHFAMIYPPKPVEQLPSLEHNGVEIVCRIHHGFSTPERGPQPQARYLYGAVSPEGERHWRRSLNDIQALIDAGFKLNAAAAAKSDA